MNAVSATVQALLGGSSITNLVGQRVEPLEATQGGELPDIIVNQVSNPDEQLLQGAGKYPNARVQIDCRSRTKTGALELGDAVIARLDDLSGTFGGVAVTSFIRGDTDVTTPEPGIQTYIRIIDYHVRYGAAA